MDRALEGASRQARGRVVGEPSTASRGRVVRRNAVVGGITPLLVNAYLALTWSQPHRPVMLAVSSGLAVVCAAHYLWADAYAAARHRDALDAVVILVHLSAAATVGLLDGGVASPLGLLLLGMLPIFSIIAAPRLIAVTAGVVIVGYVVIAALGDPAPRGYVVVYVLAFLGITYVCTQHSLSLSALRRQLIDVCRIDPLTECLNRAGFDDRLAQELARARRSGDSFALVLVDLDGFKAVNDTLGHAAGDALLTWTAQTLRGAVRGHDVVGRIGGDEFAILLTLVDPGTAPAAARRLQQQLGHRSPASVGVAVFPEDGADADTLRRAADGKVYEDKARRGRPRLPEQSQHPADGPPTRATTNDPTAGPHERRRRAIEQTGWLVLANVAIGALYVVAFGRAMHRVPILLIVASAVLLGLGLVAGADRIAAAGRVGLFMTGTMVATCLMATAVTVLDGGLGSPLSIGILSAMPLVALAAPPVRAAATGAVMVTAYLAVAVASVPVATWVVVSHLVVFLVVSGSCAVQARVAARQRSRLFLLSRTDFLTGCLNRRGYEERVASALSRADRDGPQPSLLLIDLDHFKEVNDTAGHAVGDELLQWVAASLHDAVRTEDAVARLGGDEFAVLLSPCPAQDAGVVSQRLRARLSERTSVSLGVATLGEHGHDLEALVRHADALLYGEKAGHSRRRAPATG